MHLDGGGNTPLLSILIRLTGSFPVKILQELGKDSHLFFQDRMCHRTKITVINIVCIFCQRMAVWKGLNCSGNAFVLAGEGKCHLLSQVSQLMHPDSSTFSQIRNIRLGAGGLNRFKQKDCL